MKINKKLLALSLASAFMFLGCASKEVHKNELVSNKQMLKQSPLDENVLYYMNSNFDVNNFNKLYVRKISVIKNENSKNVDEKVLKQITSYLQSSLENRLSSVIQNNKKDGELALEIAISNIDVSYKDLAFYQYLPYGLAFTALKRGTGFEQKKTKYSIGFKINKSSKWKN